MIRPLNYVIHDFDAKDREYNVGVLWSYLKQCVFIEPLKTQLPYHKISGANFWRESAKATTDNPVPYRHLRQAELSLMATNICIMETFLSLYLKNDLMNSIAIFEDDCYFKVDKEEYLETLDSAPKEWDVLVIGGAYDHSICKSLVSKGRWTLVSHPSTNTTSSIIYNKKCLPAILTLMNKFSLPLDWHLNYVFKTLDLKVWHPNPYLAGQNLFESSIQNAK